MHRVGVHRLAEFQNDLRVDRDVGHAMRGCDAGDDGVERLELRTRHEHLRDEARYADRRDGERRAHGDDFVRVEQIHELRAGGGDGRAVRCGLR